MPSSLPVSLHNGLVTFNFIEGLLLNTDIRAANVSTLARELKCEVLSWAKQHFLPPGIRKSFQEPGTVTIPLFNWLTKDKELFAILSEEVRMYDWHVRRFPGSIYGWLKDCTQSIFQTIVRTDPQLYGYYVMLPCAN